MRRIFEFLGTEPINSLGKLVMSSEKWGYDGITMYQHTAKNVEGPLWKHGLYSYHEELSKTEVYLIHCMTRQERQPTGYHGDIRSRHYHIFVETVNLRQRLPKYLTAFSQDFNKITDRPLRVPG